MGDVSTILWKDVLRELRTREIVVSVGVFALLTIVIFSFAFEPGADRIGAVAAGALWVAITFAAVLGMNRAFALEKERATLEGILLSPVSRDSIYFGKLLALALFMLAVEVVTIPIFAILLDLPLLLPLLIPIVILATVGIAAAGTLFAAIAVNTRSRELLLPVLLLPVLVPIILGAVQSTSAVLAGRPWAEYGVWLQLMGAFDVIYLVMSAWVFSAVVSET